MDKLADRGRADVVTLETGDGVLRLYQDATGYFAQWPYYSGDDAHAGEGKSA